MAVEEEEGDHEGLTITPVRRKKSSGFLAIAGFVVVAIALLQWAIVSSEILKNILLD